MIWDRLKTYAWQLGAAGLAILVLALGAALMVEKAQTARLDGQVAALTQRIEDPKTGYIAQLERCRANRDQIEASLTSQNAQIAAKAARDAAALAAAEKALGETRGRVRRLEDRAAVTLAFTPTATDACARLDEIRRAYLASLTETPS